MKNLIIVTLLICTTLFSCKNESFKSCLNLDLEYGDYEVGFKSYNNCDTCRYFPDTSNKSYRPIQTAVWYPAIRTDNQNYMKFADYLYLIGIELKFKKLDSNTIDNIINTYVEGNAAFKFGIPKRTALKELNVESKALRNAEIVNHKFPVIIYATGSNGLSFQNSVICEYLSSYGYVVIASPNVGYKTRYIQHYRDDFKEIETHAKDIEYLINFAETMPNTNCDNIGLIGFSFGGTSSVLASCEDDRIKALVSFDGSIRYNYPIHEKQSEYFKPDSLKIPFLYLSDKPVPIDTLKKYEIPDLEFNYFQGLHEIDAFHFELSESMHENFSSWFIKFSRRMPEYGESSIKRINKGHEAICSYTKEFFDWTLKQDEKALIFLENSPSENGLDNNTIKLIERKQK